MKRWIGILLVLSMPIGLLAVTVAAVAVIVIELRKSNIAQVRSGSPAGFPILLISQFRIVSVCQFGLQEWQKLIYYIRERM